MDEVKYKNFACSCGDENKQECAKIMDWAVNLMTDNPEFIETTKEYFLERAVLELSYRWGASITGIYGDQWFLVTASSRYWEDYEQKEGFDTSIQCDRILDGIAYTMKAFYGHYGPKRIWIENGSGTD